MLFLNIIIYVRNCILALQKLWLCYLQCACQLPVLSFLAKEKERTQGKEKENWLSSGDFFYVNVWGCIKLSRESDVFLVIRCFLKRRLNFSIFPVACFDEHSDFLSLWRMKEKSKTLGRFSFKAIALFSKVHKLLWWLKTYFLIIMF